MTELIPPQPTDPPELTNDDVASIFAGLDEDAMPPYCTDVERTHRWAAWEFNLDGSAEYRLCANCGGMEQQWIS